MKALVLAGGFPQIALIKELKSRKIEVVLADYYKDPVAKKYADKFYQVSNLDIEAIRNVVRVSEDLGLPCYIDYQTALNVTNKQYMKKVFIENGNDMMRRDLLVEIENM